MHVHCILPQTESSIVILKKNDETIQYKVNQTKTFKFELHFP